MKTTNTLIAITAAFALHATTTLAQSGALDLTFMHRVGPNSNVNAVVVQPDGKVLFGGEFTNVNLTARPRLARVNTDGELDAAFDPGSGPDGVVHALALRSDGKMLIGGAFTNYNGTARARLARLNADGTLDATFDPGAGADGLVRFVAVQTNGQVLIQGSFTTYSGTPRLGLARLNDNGSLDSSFDPGSRAANLSALAWQPDGKVVFSGAFTNLDGLIATNLARLNADGSLDTNFTALARLDTRADSVVVQRDGKILLTGLFTNVNGAPFNRIARLSPDGSLDSSFNPGMGFNLSFAVAGRAIRSVEQPDGQLLVWGAFNSFNGTNRNGTVRLNSNGSFDPSFNPPTGILVITGIFPTIASNICVQADGQVLVPSRSAPFLRRLLSDGSVDTTWMSEVGANGSGVVAMVLQSDGKSLLGGAFTQVNGVPRTGLARLHSDGRLDAGYNPNLGTNAFVCSLALQADGKLVVGGSFTNVNGGARTNLARLNADGSLDATFNPTLGTNDWIQTVVWQPDGQLLVSGQFVTGPGSVDWTSLIRLNADGSRDTAYDVRWQGLGGGYSVRQPVALQPDNKLVISGEFTSVNGVARTNLARLNSDGSLDASFDAGLGGPNSYISDLALQSDGKLLVGGLFDKWNGNKRPGLVRLQPNGRLDEAFAPLSGASSAAVRALLVQPDGRIQVGGEIYWPSAAMQSLARLNPDGGWDSTFNPGTGPDNYVLYLALQSDGYLLIGGFFTSVSGVPRGGVARLINEFTAAPVPMVTAAYVTSWVGSNATFDVSLLGLPPFSFQWRFNGTNLPGQTNLQLQLTNLLATDAGLYTLVVSNASSTVTSAPVRLTVLPATARPGTLDPAFHASADASDSLVCSIVEQPDGKLLVGGYFTTFNGQPHSGLVRLQPNGNVDTNFTAIGCGGEGVFGGPGWVERVLLQPDGKLVVLGSFTNFNGVSVNNMARLDPDGSLDPSFNAGINMTAWFQWPFMSASLPMALQPDGKIIIGGPFSEVNGAVIYNLVRLNADGSTDSSFNPGYGPTDYTAEIVLQPDGKVLVGGSTRATTGRSFTRLESNGAPDPSFDPGLYAQGSSSWVHPIVLQPDGKIVIGGTFQKVHAVPRDGLARLNPDGTLDETFVPAAHDSITTLVLQPDGKLVASFFFEDPYGGENASVARFNPDGSLDSSFARGYGTCASSLGGILCTTRLANGQILVGGDLSSFDDVSEWGMIVRLHGDEAITSLLPFSLGARWNAGVFEVGLFGEAGRTYTIEAATSLPQFLPWTNVTSTGTNWLADPQTPTPAQRFYRARTTN